MNGTRLLDTIHSPADVKQLDFGQLQELCAEIRAFLIDSVSKTGGHLSSNLGTIELTVALHKVFATPSDKFVWDVGHQCYTHKILTGRREGFDRLRMLGGISGFPSPRESEHDAFIAGHGNTSLSAAIGMAQAKKLRHEPGKVIAVVGDGAFTGGMIYEGMNNIRSLNNLIVVLNDNKMSISKNVGSVAQYLTQLRTSPRYFKAKRDVESLLDSTPVVGGAIKAGIQTVKSAFRRSLYHSTMFEEMGFQYVGPVDGHDVKELSMLFDAYRQEQSAPLFVHVLTIKGKGFTPAEQNPGEFHGVSAFDVNHLTDPDVAPDSSFSTVFGQQLAQLAGQDERICAITAAMKYGTGLQYFYKQHKSRFFDVGMAEQHAVTFAAGLAANGMRPVVSIYSTFLQRGYDQIIHDVNLQRLSVLFAVDRAGLVPGDGETHQGLFDAAFLSSIYGMTVYSPASYAELEYAMERALYHCKGPVAVRYPRGGASASEADHVPDDWLHIKNGGKTLLISYGRIFSEVRAAAKLLAESKKPVDLLKLCRIAPLPEECIRLARKYETIYFVEEGVRNGGIGEHFLGALAQVRYRGRMTIHAVDDPFVPQMSVQSAIRRCGFDAKAIAKAVAELYF